jgi:hypothetical protein
VVAYAARREVRPLDLFPNGVKTIPYTALTPNVSLRNPAKSTYEHLAIQIQLFESELDEDHEIGARLVSFDPSVVLHIDGLGYHGPDIICFYGVTDNGERVQLIQNIAQLSVLLIALPKRSEEPKRIGFKLDPPTQGEEAELEAQRCKISAYYALRRLHEQVPRDSQDWDMSAIENLLALHGHQLTIRLQRAVETALDSLTDLKTRADYLTPDDVDLMEKVFNDIGEACDALREELDRSTENR